MNEYLIYFVIGVIIFAIAMSLFKSVIRSLFVVVIAILIFRVAWVYSADELFETFRLNSILNEDKQEEIYDKYDEYTQRRNPDSLIDVNKVDESIREKEERIRIELEKKLNNEN